MSYNGPLPQVVNAGGTGRATLTNHGVLVGAGTTAVTQLAVGTNGQVPVGSTGADPAFATLTSSDSSISFTTGANTLSMQVAGGSTAIKTITGNSGGAESPSAGNFNVLGTGSITVAGTANTETVQLTGITNHAIQIGAGTATLTQLGAGTTGQVLQTNTSADPTWSTATYPSTTTSQQILYSTANNVVGELSTANSKLPATNSSGTLAMRAFSVVIQTFTSTGTYTPTAGMLYCQIQAVGGGGAGGGGAAATGQYSTGGGGGSGENAVGVFSAATIGASQSVTIGAAGAGASGTTGGNGGNTSVGALISANGGSGGPVGAAGASSSTAGGAGGTGGTGGSYRVNGSYGGSTIAIVASGINIGGNGANSPLGAGALYTFNANGAAGTGNGSGGGGAGDGGGGVARTGGAGTKGAVIVTEYVIA